MYKIFNRESEEKALEPAYLDFRSDCLGGVSVVVVSKYGETVANPYVVTFRSDGTLSLAYNVAPSAGFQHGDNGKIKIV